MKRRSRLVDIALLLALLVIALGAYTRLTDAGLGCPDWPGCYGRLAPPVHALHVAEAQARFPDAQVDPSKARNEMVHRYLAGLLGLCVLAIFAVSRRLPRGRGLATALLALVAFQAALGMWTVTMNLMPVVVVAHLCGGFGVLALLGLLRFELGRADPPGRRGAAAPDPQAARLLPMAWVALAVLLVQIALGGWTAANYAAVACHQLPLCESGWTTRFSLGAAFSLPPGQQSYEFGVLPFDARVSIHVLHRIGALAAAGVLAGLVLQCRRRACDPQSRRLAACVGALLVLQLVLGVVNVVGQVPLLNAVAHNLTAACLLATLALLIRRLHLAGDPGRRRTHGLAAAADSW